MVIRYNTEMNTSSWSDEESFASDFGDLRITKRMSKLLERLSEQPSASIPTALGGWDEIQAAYRFFDNERVTARRIITPHRTATISRMKGQPVILGIQDTSFFNYYGQPDIEDLGPHSHNIEYGYFAHPVIAVTPDRICLGVLSVETWIREFEDEKTKKRASRPIEEKESMRWLRGYDALASAHDQVPNAKLICIGDRESDIYEMFAHARPHQAEWLVRATHDRALVDGEKMRAAIAKSTCLGSHSIEVPHKGPYPVRTATVEVRAKRVCLSAPHRADKQLPDIDVTVILVNEINPPDPSQHGPAVEWLLLTSVDCPTTYDGVMEIVEWYRCRWMIERFFYVLKSGCAVEKLQLQTRKRLEAALAMYMIIAWRVLFATILSRSGDNIPARVLFTEDEVRVAYGATKRERPAIPLLCEVVCLVASMGGYIIRKGQGPPGPKTLWTGWQNLRLAVMGVQLAREWAKAGDV